MPMVYRAKNFYVETRYVGLGKKRVDKGKIVHKNVAVILAIVDGKILFVRQRRPIINRTILELPAGHVEKSEDPRQTAYREFSEETGYNASKMRFLFYGYSSPGIETSKYHFYLAEGLKKGKMHLDVGEKLKPLLIEPEKAISMIASNKINDFKTIGCLLWARQKKLI